MKQRKVISILLTAAMVVTMAAGCVKQEPAGKEAAAAVSEEASADTETDLVLEPVDIKEYGVAPKITDFVPEDADTSGTKRRRNTMEDCMVQSFKRGGIIGAYDRADGRHV